MVKHVTGLVVAGVVALGSAAAVAGTHYNQPVIITRNSDGTGDVEGALGSARNNEGDYAEIGCYIAKYDAAAPTRATCYAYEESGAAAICTTAAPALVEAIAFTSEGAYVIFTFDAAGKCTGVDIEVGSGYEPKAS